MLRWKVGDVTITQVVELETASIGSMVLPQATPELVRAIPWLSPHFLDAEGRLLFSINALLVESGGRRIVVDTCLGNDKERPYRAFNMLSGPFLRDLDEAGAPREAVERRRGRSPADRPGRTQRGSACDGARGVSPWSCARAGFRSRWRDRRNGCSPRRSCRISGTYRLSLERNRLEFYRRLERFLETHLASREAADASMEAQAEASR